jgi:hypothetical protein
MYCYAETEYVSDMCAQYCIDIMYVTANRKLYTFYIPRAPRVFQYGGVSGTDRCGI